MTAPLQPMNTRSGMSVRREIETRLDEARAAAFEEVITFLIGSGFADAAETLQHAAFEAPHDHPPLVPNA